MEDLKADIEDPSEIVVVYDSTPVGEVVRSASKATARRFAMEKGVRYTPRVGFFTLEFALNARPIFMDTLKVEAVRRSILR